MHRLTEHDTGSMREVRGLQSGKDRYSYMIHRAWMTVSVGKYGINYLPPSRLTGGLSLRFTLSKAINGLAFTGAPS